MNRLVTGFIILVLLTTLLAAQEKGDYQALYNQGKYEESLNIIHEKLDAFYLTRLDDKRMPTGFITMNTNEKQVDLIKLFRERKVKGFFLEENDDVFTLHAYAGRNYAKTKKYDKALSHFFQSLRYRKAITERDHDVFYEISQVFKEKKLFTGYLNYLESAARLKPGNMDYARELGLALSRTPYTARAVHYLRRSLEKQSPRNPVLYLTAASLYENLGNYLETEVMYEKYLEKKNQDGNVLFAYGYLTYKHTGHHDKAERSFQKALDILPESDTYRRSKSHEYLADILFKNLKYRRAADQYRKTMVYQEKVMGTIRKLEEKKAELTSTINTMKRRILTEPNFTDYEEYEEMRDRKGKLEAEIISATNDFNKLNAGRVRWFLALSHERLEEYQEAIKWYRQAVFYHYKARKARENIIKLRLKIKRGY